MCRKLRFSQKIIRSQPIPIEKMSRSKRVNAFKKNNYVFTTMFYANLEYNAVKKVLLLTKP